MSSGRIALLLALLCLSSSVTISGRFQTTVTLTTSASPSTGQPGVHTITLTGSNYPTGTIAPADVTVTVQPATAGAGPTASTAANTVTTVVGSTRRVTFTIPASIVMTTPTAYQVTIAGRTTTGITFSSSNRANLTINPPAKILSLTPPGGNPGASLAVAISTQYTNFVQGATQASFGPGIAVGGAADGAFGTITVHSPTTATAQIAIGPSASPIPRSVTVRTGVQVASLSNAFTVATSNQSPTANAGGPYSGVEDQAIAIAGTANDPDNDALTYTWNFGDQTPDGQGASTSHTYGAPGDYTLTLTVSDGRGGSVTVSTTVAVAAQPNLAPAFTSAPVTNAEHQRPYTYQAAASDPDGDALTYSVSSVPQGLTIGPTSGLVEWTPTGAQLGALPVTLIVTDARGASATQPFDISVVDATPPIVTLSMPSESLPGRTVTASARALDNVAVVSVRFEVNGADASLVPALPFERAIPVPPTALAGTEFHVRAIATDAAGNSGHSDAVFKVAAIPDTTPPSLTLNVPPEATAGANVALTASPQDNVGVKSVTFRLGDLVIATDVEAPFETPFVVPADAAVGSSLAFTARATDFSDNLADAAGTTTVVAAPDTTPPTVELTLASSVLEGGTLTFSATANDNVGVAGVEFLVNGIPAGAAAVPPYTGSFALPTALVGGDIIHVEARARDFAGLSAADADQSVVLSAPNRTPTAHAGGPYTAQVGAPIELSAALSSDPDQDALVYHWNFGDDTTGSGLTPRHGFAAQGTFTATLTVDDGRGGVAVAQTTVLVSAATDDNAPSISLTGPTSVLPASQVTMTAQAADDVGVVAVTFRVNGANPTETSLQPFQRVVEVPGVASPGDSLTVTATARDAAGNEATAEAVLTITGAPDTQNPTVAVIAPSQIGAGTVLRLSATAADDVGVESVSFVVNGAAIGTLPAPPYEVSYTVPADATVGSTIGVVVQATDYTGNRGDASAGVVVVATADGDTTPPTVTLSAPLQVFAGRTLPLSADASDNAGIAAVRFFVDGVNVATLNAPPFVVDVPLGATHVPGSLLQLRAVAVDFSNLDAFAVAQTLVVATDSAGQGVLSGEVYDDAVSLPLEGATVALTGTDSTGAAYTQSTTTDARGRWSLRATEGDGVVQISRGGWTRVDRHATVIVDRAVEIVDARLSRVIAAGPALSAVLGGQITTPVGAGPPASLSVPPGALQTATALALTPLSQQGLAGVLPTGWSPVAAADVAPHGVAFASNATLSLPNTFSIPDGTSLVVASWDESVGAWRARAAVLAPPAGSPLVAPIDRSGQYALLLADAQPLQPALPASDDPIAGVPAHELDADVTAVVDPQPKVLFYQPGVRSEVNGRVSAVAPVSSGAPIEARISESYQFLNGTDVSPEPFVEDLFFYQAGSTAPGLAGRFVVTPSQTFEALSLRQGVIAIELLAPPLGLRFADALGANGGAVTTPTGERLQIPQGALAGFVPVSVRALTAGTVGVTLPPGLTLVGSVLVNIASTLAKSATLSVPKPAQVTDASRLLLVRAQEIAGETRLVLVGRAVILGSQIVSELTLNGVPDVFDGVRTSGRHLFVSTSEAIGFAQGRVTLGAGAAAANALISSSTVPVVALSRANGNYVDAAATGLVEVTALDLASADRGNASGLLQASGGVIALDVQIAAALPAVTSIQPADGAANVTLASPVVIAFSRAIDPASVNSANAGNVVLTDPAGAPVPATVSLSNNNGVLTLRPAAALLPNTQYTVRISTGVADFVGRHLPVAVTAQFTSLDTAPPPMPAAGSISASIPDAAGLTTIAATQGSAGVHDTVTIVNLTKGSSAPALVNPDGSFSTTIAAAMTDRLQIAITDQSGNQTIVAVAQFTRRNADGSVSVAVGPQGGKVLGTAGTEADIAADTFPTGAVVTLKHISESAFPVGLTIEQAAVFSYSGGFEIDFGGAIPTRYVNVSVSPSPGDTPDDQWIVSQVLQANGDTFLNVVDTAKLITGRITTSSPPCPGVTAAGTYGIHKSNRPVGVTFANVAPSFAALLARASSENDGFLMPGAAYVGVEPSQICLPVLSGRVTVTLNTVSVRVDSQQIEIGDTDIVIKNNKTQSETRFAREELFYAFSVGGTVADQYEVRVATPTGSSPVPFKLSPEGAASVRIALTPDALGQTATQVIISRSAAAAVFTFAPPFHLRLSAAGGATDGYSVKASNPANVGGRPLLYTVDPSAIGPEHLVLRALPGTIDPTLAELLAAGIGGVGRSSVVLIDKTTSVRQTVPPAKIVKGAIEWSFAGELDHDYAIEVRYDDGDTDVQNLPRFKIVVANPAGTPVRTVVFPSPPLNQPLNLGTLSDDVDPPALSISRAQLRSFDPVLPLTITFSEAMDVASLQTQFKVYNRHNQLVQGQIRISNQNRSVTFVPDEAFAFADTYVIKLVGLVDRGGNHLLPAEQWLRLRTVAPRLITELTTAVNPARPLEGLKDIQIQRKTVAGQTQTTILAVTSAKIGVGFKFVTIDVTDPTAPVETGHAVGGAGKFRLQLLPGVTGLTLHGTNKCAPGGTTFSGDIGLTTTYSTQSTFVSFFDITDRTNPCLLADKILAANPFTMTDSHRQGTVHALGYAKGVAAVQHASGWTAFTAIQEIGLTATDIGQSIPEAFPGDRQKDGVLAGDYIDVVNVSDRLVALNRGAPSLDVIDPNLVVLTSVPLPDKPRRLVYVPGLPFDLNRDGTITSQERMNAAFIGSDRSVVIADLTDLLRPFVVGSIAFGGIVKDLDVDASKLRMYAVEEHTVSLVDLRKAHSSGLIDTNADGIDDRIAWRATFPDIMHTVRVDTERNYFYVGYEKGLRIYNLGPPNLTGVATFTFFPVDTTRPVNGNVNVGLLYACKNIDGKPVCPEDKPIRGAVVELRQGASVLALTNTDEDGYYAFDAPVGPQVTVAVKAALGTPGQETVKVVDNTTANLVYEVVSAPFPVQPPTTKNVHAQTTFVRDPNPLQTSYPDRHGAPFAILDVIYRAHQTIRSAVPNIVFPPLDVAWSRLNKRADPTDYPLGNIGTSHYSPATKTLYILGFENNDTDEYDSMVIAHEWSHYFQDNFSRSDSIGGNHAIGGLVDPRVAFGEGFATAFAGMLLGQQHYVDTLGLHQGSASPDDLDFDINQHSGFYSEDAVRELLWDLFDPDQGAENDKETNVARAEEVELGFKPIVHHVMNGMRTSPAFTTIFSFFGSLLPPLAANPALETKIKELAKQENIDLLHSDAYELFNNVTINGVDVGRLYTDVPPTGVLVEKFSTGPFTNNFLQTQLTHDPPHPQTGDRDGNKLHEYVFFRVVITTAGDYRLEVRPVTTNAWVVPRLYDRGQLVAGSGTTEEYVVHLQPGTYVGAVTGIDTAGNPKATTLTIKVSPVP